MQTTTHERPEIAQFRAQCEVENRAQIAAWWREMMEKRAASAATRKS